MDYLKSEHLKFKRTISNKLIFIVPLITAIFAWIMGGYMGYQYMTLYWWYAFLLPGAIAILCSLSHRKEENAGKYYSVFSMPVNLSRFEFAKGIILVEKLLVSAIFLALLISISNIIAPATAVYSLLHSITGSIGIILDKLNRYDLIILDIMMPDVDGFSYCDKIRSLVDCPILFLTAKTMEHDITFGLGLGADDYLTKPFRIAELRARVNAHLRRERRERHTALTFDRIKIDLSAKELRVDNTPVALTKSEYLICEYLARNKGQVFSKEQIYETVFGLEGDSDNSTISTHIKNIRSKLNKLDIQPIATVWGIGYKWE